MNHTVGHFLIVQAILTYLLIVTVVEKVFPPIIYEITNINTGITTISYTWIDSIRYVIPIILFIFGIYFMVAKKGKGIKN